MATTRKTTVDPLEEGIPFGNAPWRTLLRLYRPEARSLVVGAIFYVIKAAPTWILPLIQAIVIDSLLKPKRQALTTILWCGIGGAVALLQNIPTHTLYFQSLSKAARSVEARLRYALCRRLQELSISFYRFQSPGKLQTKVLRDVENVDQTVRQLVELTMSGFVGLTATLTITALKAPWFLPFYLFTVPAAVGLRHLLQRRIRIANQDFRLQIEGMSSSISEMIDMVPLTRAHAVEQVELAKVRTSIDRLREVGYRLDFQNAIFGSAAWVLFNGMYLLGLLLAGSTAALGLTKLSAGEIVMLSGFFNTIAGTVMGMVNAMPMLMRGFESVRSMGEVLECPDLEQNRGKNPVGEVRGEFRFEAVTFTYPNKDDQPALSDFSLEVPAGTTVAVVGASGSGKSTLMSLILGFHRPTTGRILLDGRDMNELDLRTYRRHLAVVTQETLLFPGTVRENVLYGAPDVTEERLMEALKDAHAWEFVSKLPAGLDTIMGERASTLSGGQRQRLAIARALVRNPRILILDEATSALDHSSEALVQEALNRLMRGRTTFIVAHRLSTTRKADVMVAMEAGRMVEIGPPETVLRHHAEELGAAIPA
ncbi:MAG TPA: ABC transporter ATP-binding protein [Chthoniobacteraceae bacterium]|nr:ABC transporter ATP-binding protein [Chthoniobacteraceae bacterium]